jgi:hypothetical protein
MMGYTIKFETTIEWEITDGEAEAIRECETPEAFIKYQEHLLQPRYTGRQSLEDFVANGAIKSGNWGIYTDDAVDMGGEWKKEEL